jgi:hypothetical protein
MKHTQSPIIVNDHLISFSDTILVTEAASFNNNLEMQSLLQCTQFKYVFSHLCILKTDFYTAHFTNLCGYFNSNITIVCTFTKVQGEHKVFPRLQTFITRKLREKNIFFSKCNSTQEVFFTTH